jgi:hypothetical protein
MKTRSLIAVAILLLTGSLAADVSAQETLKALVKKCESTKNAKVEIIRRRNKETKKLEKVITEVKLGGNQALLNEFIAAFEKDSEMADKETESIADGEIKELYYRFGSVAYILEHKGRGASVIVIEDF